MNKSLDMILNQLILIAGQWRNKDGDLIELENHFNNCLNQIQEITEKSREQVVQMLISHIEGGTKA